MNCKFCNAEMEEGITLCPACGKENLEDLTEAAVEPAKEIADVAEETTEMTEEVAEVTEEGTEMTEETAEVTEEVAAEESEETPKKKHPKWLIVLAVVGAVAIAAVLGAAIIFGIKSSAPAAGSYSVSDSKAVKERDTVVATVGDVELTNSALQVYYWQAINEYQSNYGYYLDSSVLDFTKPLDQQFQDKEAGVTWQKFFLDGAINSWSRYAALNMQAKEDHFQLSEEMQTYVESLPDQVKEMATSYGYDTVAAMLEDDMGAASDETGYMEYLHTNIYASQYLDSVYDSLVPDMAEIESYYAENEEALNAQGIAKDGSVTVDVRHILLCPEGGTTGENGETIYTVAEWDLCRIKAQELLDKWASESGTEEGFAQFAMEHTEDPGSMSTGGLYTDVYEGQMVEPFEDWCFDESRQYGDTGLVQTSYGYHSMYYVGSEEIWINNVSDLIIYERSMELVNGAAEKWPATIYDNKIVLSTITLETAE